MDAIIRTRLERLEALIDAAPSPYAWIQLCAALSEWTDHDGARVVADGLGAEHPRAAAGARGGLEGPLLPATGGGSCPVQHNLYYRDRVYYVRFRHDHLSVDLE